MSNEKNEYELGEKMAEMSEQSSFTDKELESLIAFYPTVIGFLRKKGDALSANYLLRELEQLRSFKFHRDLDKKR